MTNFKLIISEGKNLFLCSFLILFLELALIRYIPANVRLIGYFTNLILLATFLGMGVGILLCKKRGFLSSFPLLLFILIIIVGVFKTELKVSAADIIFLRSPDNFTNKTEPEILLPIIYLLTTLLFIPLGQLLGQLFTKFKPLTAYSIDILGAIFGIMLFTLLSFLSTPSFVWFIIISLIFIYLYAHKKIWKILYATVTLSLIILYVYGTNQGVIWSPYYRISLTGEYPSYVINVNNITHQAMIPARNLEGLYYALYDQSGKKDFKDILIIGAGNGVDVAAALIRNPELNSIDAVEIDPKINEIGRKLNPDKPFDDPRVNVIIDDGKNFLQNSNKKYDLIIFALTDSLTTVGTSGNIRLESFLFTTETLGLAKNHLTDSGVLVTYNYYVKDWLVDKLALMLQQAFGSPPFYITDRLSHAAVLMTGPNFKEIPADSAFKLYSNNRPLELSTDNWPFFYLKDKSIPAFYIKFLVVIFIISTALILLAIGKERKNRFDFKFFFLGAGFLLLETKSLVTFSMLFGTTWLVNPLVIMAILIFILIANLISQKFNFQLRVLYFLLFGILIINIFVPTSLFLNLPLIWRYPISSLFYLSPIFIANLIFSQRFKKQENFDISFASNMLGALLGGLLEYMALLVGYSALIVLVIVFYVLSFIKIKNE